MASVKISWYGRCCFLIEINQKKILLDPYDNFQGTDIGKIASDFTIISSVAHDHGNIASSPQAYIHGYRGRYRISENVYFNGIESKENRGTLNLICNIEAEQFNLTNFADWGDPRCVTEFTEFEKAVLSKTNIGFFRTRIVQKELERRQQDLIKEVAAPQILIPQHYFPLKFYQRFKIETMYKFCNQQLEEIENMVKNFDQYQKVVIDSYQTELFDTDLEKKQILIFNDIHPQVRQI